MATDWQVSEVGDTCRAAAGPCRRRSVQIEWLSAGTAHLGFPALLSVPHLLSREIKMNRRHCGVSGGETSTLCRPEVSGVAMHVSGAPSVAHSTGCSRVVTHPGTYPARRCLTSVIWRKPVCLYANKPADWHTWQMIMMFKLSICCHAMPSLTIFKQALSILWLIIHEFLQATKLNCKKCYVFSEANTWLFSHENNARSSNFSHSLTFFLQTQDRKKKIVLNIEQWKNKERLSEIYQNLLKPSWSR